MKIGDTAQRGLRAALTASTRQKDFYWIGKHFLLFVAATSKQILGVSSSPSHWRWADGAVVASGEADWSGSPILPSNSPEAIVLARVADWRWIPSAQNVWNSFLCQSSEF